MLALINLLRNCTSSERAVMPRRYLCANAEILFLTICVSLCITYIFNPEQLANNPIKDMVGYNNPCVAWDAAPALYIAWFMFTPTAYFAIRYAMTDSMLAFLKGDDLATWKKISILILNSVYAVSQMIVMGIFVVTPLPTGHPDALFNMRFHSACFLQLVPTLGICMCMNYMEALWDGRGLKTMEWIAMVLYIMAWVAETVFASIAVFGYAGDGIPVLPPIFMQIVDWGWFATLPLAATFQPVEAGMALHAELLDPEQTKALDASAGCCNDPPESEVDEESPGEQDWQEVLHHMQEHDENVH